MLSDKSIFLLTNDAFPAVMGDISVTMAVLSENPPNCDSSDNKSSDYSSPILKKMLDNTARVINLERFVNKEGMYIK